MKLNIDKNLFSRRSFVMVSTENRNPLETEKHFQVSFANACSLHIFLVIIANFFRLLYIFRIALTVFGFTSKRISAERQMAAKASKRKPPCQTCLCLFSFVLT